MPNDKKPATVTPTITLPEAHALVHAADIARRSERVAKEDVEPLREVGKRLEKHIAETIEKRRAAGV
jgi:hypothetical protein